MGAKFRAAPAPEVGGGACRRRKAGPRDGPWLSGAAGAEGGHSGRRVRRADAGGRARRRRPRALSGLRAFPGARRRRAGVAGRRRASGRPSCGDRERCAGARLPKAPRGAGQPPLPASSGLTRVGSRLRAPAARGREPAGFSPPVGVPSQGDRSVPEPGPWGSPVGTRSPCLGALTRWWEYLRLELQDFKARVCLCHFYF